MKNRDNLNLSPVPDNIVHGRLGTPGLELMGRTGIAGTRELVEPPYIIDTLSEAPNYPQSLPLDHPLQSMQKFARDHRQLLNTLAGPVSNNK
jgi:hypothetical protein